MFFPGNQLCEETSHTLLIAVERHFSLCINKDFNVKLFDNEELRGTL